MTVTGALDTLAGLGVTVTVDGDRLRYRPAPPDLLKPELSRLKADILAHLSPAIATGERLRPPPVWGPSGSTPAVLVRQAGVGEL